MKTNTFAIGAIMATASMGIKIGAE
jgi:hypothetical protein